MKTFKEYLIEVNTQDVLKDKNDDPIIFYHGTHSEDFSEFDTNISGYHYGPASYFTPDPNRAAHYAGRIKSEFEDEEDKFKPRSRIYPVYLKLDKPFITNSHEGVVDVGFKEKNDPKNQDKYRGIPYANLGNQILREQGYDGVIKSWKWDAREPLEVAVFYKRSIISIYS